MRCVVGGIVGLGLCALSACAGLGSSQGCVERSLRAAPNAEDVRLVAPQLERGCRLGDAASCSAFGVILERGLIAAPNPRAAAQLYHRACRDGNAPACGNLGALLVAHPQHHVRGLQLASSE